ncbi:ATP-grasp peptide maturase system methyltransferase [Streptomyces bauhiniae]|uniref:ATP-grasp peptide maturase system methyltransferase n=1 Tax=Streptomyces bauhiniae TaxID=2340725 RepID=UPI003658FACE
MDVSVRDRLHRRLVDELTAGGALRSTEWRAAAEAVPRHEFLRGGFFRRVPGEGSRVAWRPVEENDCEWLAGCYTDESLVTQIADSIRPEDVRGEILREPTSSSTLPSLVLRMLEEARIEPGMSVLEIGTGTGYSTALLCTRLGDGSVTSVEYDQEVAARAHRALATFGAHPALVCGDGLRGHPGNAPYDRIISTCGVRAVPAEWVRQTRPGGQLLVPLAGWLGAGELVRLTVQEDGTAAGPVLAGGVHFMLARPQLAPPLGLLPDLSGGEERCASVGGDVLDDWATRFVVQFAVPGAQQLRLSTDGRDERVLIDVENESWAALHEVDGRWTVRQGGPVALWDAVEAGLGRWHAEGAPGLERATVRVTPESQSITWRATTTPAPPAP